ncbi:MAG: glutamate--tRNA ligase family protein, partial [Pseudomonadota bacterium]|nr:glutamate--tRNA ligase family protein [Pseudomonadota bacterium]
MTQYRGRFAPSATGPLHLGSILAALVSYIHAKHHHGDWLIRIDDLDRKRCNQIHVDSILDCLDAFGFSPSASVCRQTDRISDYQNALSSLEEQGRL